MSRPGREPTWYVAYGSNLAAARFRCYISGGRPEGARRIYTGCRDVSDPAADRPLELPGELLFAGRSTVWSGGIAFYRVEAAGTVAARAYLLTAEQVNDVVAQEVRHPPGRDYGLSALEAESAATLGEGGYDTVRRLSDIDGVPAVTITAHRPLDPAPPSAAYLRWLCVGLREAHGWTAERVARYLGSCRGVQGQWPRDTLVALARGG